MIGVLSRCNAMIDEKKLEERLVALEAAKSWSPRVVSRLEMLLRSGTDEALYRINPVLFATEKSIAEAEAITEIVCVQNFYNIAHRGDDGFIDRLTERGIAYVPFFPLGGFSPLQSSALDALAVVLEATPMQVALAWLLQRAPNILLIPGTSSLEHLRLNLQAATLRLPSEALADLDAIGRIPGH